MPAGVVRSALDTSKWNYRPCSKDLLSLDYWNAPRVPSALWKAVGVAERIMAVFLTAMTFPILLFSAAAVTALSRQAPFVAHRRVGLRGRVLWVWKLRTMWNTGPGDVFDPALVEFLADALVPASKAERDPRVTSTIARFLRKYSIDELPQLCQVALGQLALVGPRPLTEGEIAEHYGDMTSALLSVRPGLTGLWQVKGRNRLSYKQRRRLDHFLLNNWSLPLYLNILSLTAYCVITGKDAH